MDPVKRPRVATVWLGGCSGCHMSFLDLDEKLFELADRMELVYSPFIDVKRYPAEVDLALVEGAVSNEEHLALARSLREHTRWVMSLGDCAAAGNVTASRNGLRSGRVLARAYLENATFAPCLPLAPGQVPRLLERVQPLHEVIPVDLFLPGCPPSAERIGAALFAILDALQAGRQPAFPDHILYG